MKSRILIITLLMLSATMGFVINRSNTKTNTKNEKPQSTSPQENPQNRWYEKFYIGAVHDGTDRNNNYQNLVTLGFNMWHLYSVGGDEGGRNYPWIQWPGFINYNGDNTNSPVSVYSGFVNPRIEEVKNAVPNIRIVTMRPKIEYLCYGQRSDYQCEPILITDDLWFYSFNDQPIGIQETDNGQWGNGASVMHCRSIPMNSTHDNPGFVVKRLKANTEQCKRSTTPGNDWQYDSYFNWLIKPKIRIPQGFPENNRETPVCSLKVVAADGSTILKEIIIKAKYFLNDSGSYSGDYIEEYNFGIDPYNLSILGDWASGANDKWEYKARGNCINDTLIENKADIQVYWYGNCDMWIDYVRVDNDVADKLFKGYYDNPFDIAHMWIKNEVQQIGMQTHGGTDPMFMKYYMELAEFNNLPCMAYVNAKLKSYSDNKIDLVQDLTNTLSVHVPWEDNANHRDRTSIENAEFLNEHYIQKVGFTQVFAESYPLSACFVEPQLFSRIPETLFNTNDSILAAPISPAEYDTWLQDNLNHEPYVLEQNYHGGDLQCGFMYQDKGNFRYKLELGNKLSELANIPFIFMPQAHQWYRPGEIRREPTNEELNMMVNTAVSYGVKGIMYFCYNQYIDQNNDDWYGIGITEGPLNSIREKNLYGQNKGDAVKDISTRLKDKWGPHLLSFDNTNTKSVIYNFENDRNEFLSNTYFNNIITYKPGSGEPACVSQNPGGNLPSGLTYECNDDRYVQAATFKSTTSDVDKYFMIVNRRCSPYIDESSIDNRGGKRNIRVKFDLNSSDFAANNNWEIFCIDSNKTVATFNPSAGTLIDLGWFMPGHGELYKISPVVLGGGTLVADETISGNVNCNGMIYNGGHNITISPNAVVTFSDSAGIVMNGGCFVSNENADNVEAVILTGKTETTFWKGITLIGCDSIGVYNTNITNIKANDTAKAFSIINSFKVNFRRNTINANSNSGGIQAVYNSFSDNPIVFNVRECTFNMNSSGYSAISVLSNASVTLPIVTEWCLFNSQNDTSNAILFTEVTGGAIKNNVFTNFGKSVVLMYSTTDLYGNTILGKDNSQGILCLSGSYASLSPTSGQYLGGYNYIKNYGTSANNVYSNNSYFNIQNGQNDFDLSDIDNSKHLAGDLSGMPYSYVNAMKNCFHKDSVTNIDATHSVVWYDNSPVNFIFTDYSCELTPPGDFFVYQYGGYNDTVYYSPGGEGSGFNPNKPMNIEENVYKSLKDSININLRKRNYLTVEDKAKQLLTQYPDSLESATMVQKLYMASLSLDSTKIGITKTFLENLIATNTQNPTLIKRAFYFIQKCKVKLGQYQSALDGFQYIMTQNPYTYEGLVASWDYAATYLLMGAGGSYKGDLEQTTEELNTPADTLLNRMTKSDINTNKSKNTNSNRNSTEQITKTFYEKIKNVTKDDKTAQEEKVKLLEKKIETTKSKNEKSDAVTELATMKQIKEVVKLKKPNTIVTHTAIINNDIRKVFGIGKGNKDESKNSLIPQTYTLYQNYPNPFNPTTKIAYDIPHDAKVKLVIYDILGREMKTLVNNEFRSAGKYITEFNGSNLASGIYFARILVNEGKDFMAVKKMVLIK